MTQEGEHPGVSLTVMEELFLRAAAITAQSTRLYSGEAIDDAMWLEPELSGEEW